MSGALLAAELLKGGMSTGSALGIGAAAGVADFGLQQAGAALDFKRQKKLLDFQNQFSLDMWNRNNEYNDPTNQMARLIQAGISPGAAVQAISGQGAALSPNVSSTSAPGVNPSSSPHTMSNALGVAADVYNKVTSGQKNESEIKVNDAQIDKWAHENDYTDQQTNQLKIITSYLDEQQQLDIETKKHLLNQIDAQVDLLLSQRKATEKSVEKMDSEIALNSSETSYNNQRTLTEAEMTTLKQWYNNYCNQYKFSPEMDFLQAAATLSCEGKNPADAYNSLMALAHDYNFNQERGKNFADMVSKDASIFELPSRMFNLFSTGATGAVQGVVSAITYFVKNYFQGKNGSSRMGKGETKHFFNKIDKIVDDSSLSNDDKAILKDYYDELYGVYIYD